MTPVTTWRLQGLYVVAEVIVGLNASATYSFVDHTVSELGSTSCRTVGSLEVCSPWHVAMNIVFVVFGISLALGAWMLRAHRPPGRLATASLAFWIVAGIASTAVGLVPVNENGGLHAGVALWVFIAQPAALILLGLSLRTTHPRFGWATVGVGAVSVVGALGFLVLIDADHGSGAFERLAVWPVYLWVTVIAWSARSPSEPSESGPVGSVPV